MKKLLMTFCVVSLSGAALAATDSTDANGKWVMALGCAIAGGLSMRINRYRSKLQKERAARDSFRRQREILDANGNPNDTVCWFCGASATSPTDADSIGRSVPCCDACRKWASGSSVVNVIMDIMLSVLIALVLYVIFRNGEKSGAALYDIVAPGALAIIGGFAMFVVSSVLRARRHARELRHDLDDIAKIVPDVTDSLSHGNCPGSA